MSTSVLEEKCHKNMFAITKSL